MTSDRFARIMMEFVLPWEVGKDRSGKLRADGGYTNDPDDPGGETKWGISKRAHPNVDIPNLTIDEAVAIYQQHYWDVYTTNKFTPVNLDKDVDIATAAVIVDAGVNCGPARAIKWWDKAKDHKNPIKVMIELREAYYFDLVTMKPDLAKYSKGWSNRTADLKKYVAILQTT